MRPYNDNEPIGPYMVEHFNEHYRSGSRLALLQMAAWAAWSGSKIPEDAAHDLFMCLDRYWSCEARTLDDAFDLERPKGFRLADQRKRHLFGTAVYLEVERLRESGFPMDEALFEKAGMPWGIGKTLASELYYAWREHLRKIKADDNKDASTA